MVVFISEYTHQIQPNSTKVDQAAPTSDTKTVDIDLNPESSQSDDTTTETQIKKIFETEAHYKTLFRPNIKNKRVVRRMMFIMKLRIMDKSVR